VTDLNKLLRELDASARKTPDPNRQFDQLEATTLFCATCKQAVPVRKRLLLALPEGDKFDYVCVHCGNSAGTKIEKNNIPDQVILR
jgi:hypothetical protein